MLDPRSKALGARGVRAARSGADFPVKRPGAKGALEDGVEVYAEAALRLGAQARGTNANGAGRRGDSFKDLLKGEEVLARARL